MLTYRNLSQRIAELEQSLNNSKADLRSLPGYYFMEQVDRLAGLNPFLDETELTQALVDAINDRDEPMTYSDIEEVFMHSGLSYNSNHIEACNPDTSESVRQQTIWYKE